MIIRHGEDEPGYTKIPNATLENGELSLKARGLLSYLLSRPEGWEFDSVRMAKSKHARKDGRDAIRTGLTELVVAGHLERIKSQDAAGKWTTECFVFPHPQQRLIAAPTIF